jgi:hypothetical protein
MALTGWEPKIYPEMSFKRGTDYCGLGEGEERLRGMHGESTHLPQLRLVGSGIVTSCIEV